MNPLGNEFSAVTEKELLEVEGGRDFFAFVGGMTYAVATVYYTLKGVAKTVAGLL